MSKLMTIIPVYNGELYLRSTLDSIAAQTRRPDRVIVLDNCSTDGTRKVVQNYRGLDGLEYRRNERHVIVFENFNRALDFAEETECLHIMSADDLLEPRFFEVLFPHLDRMGGRGLAFTGIHVIDETGRVTQPYPRVRGAAWRRLTLREFLVRQMELRHVYCQSVVLKTARRPAPVRFRVEGWRQAVDVMFFAEWALHGESIIEVREPLCLYRLHSISITGGNLGDLDAWVMEEWRAMLEVQSLLGDAPARRWFTSQKLKCIFAARSRVKMSLTRASNPEYAREIGRRTREVVGPLAWCAGGLAVFVRDCCRKLAKRAPSHPLPQTGGTGISGESRTYGQGGHEIRSRGQSGES